MKILAISGTYRKGRTIDTLMNKAIEGIRAVSSKHTVDWVSLADRNISYCKNCMACKAPGPEQKMSKCIIDDDMNELYPLLDEADAYILGTPINVGTTTALMKTFVERVIYVMGMPGANTFPVKGIPVPRNARKRRAIYILSAGTVPPLLRCFCDDATAVLNSICECSFNARVMGTLYAGALEKKGVEYYFAEAEKLGRKLVT